MLTARGLLSSRYATKTSYLLYRSHSEAVEARAAKLKLEEKRLEKAKRKAAKRARDQAQEVRRDCCCAVRFRGSEQPPHTVGTGG